MPENFTRPPASSARLSRYCSRITAAFTTRAAGSGGMFVQSAKFIESHGGNVDKSISVYRQDSNPTTWTMAQMNLAICAISA